MYATAILATALVAAVGNAQTYIPPPLGYFVVEGFVPDKPGSPYVSAVNLQAQNGRFYTNKATNASCASGASSCCTPNSRTSFVVLANYDQASGTSGRTALYLNTANIQKGVRQQVYCSSSTGALMYTPPGDLVPYDTVGASNFTYKPEPTRNAFGSITNDFSTFSICDTKDGYKQIYCKSKQPTDLTCIDSSLATRPDFQGVAAGQYN